MTNEKLFIDSSMLIAYFVPSDDNHLVASNILNPLISQGSTIFISNDVIDEVVTRLTYTTNPIVVKLFITHIKKGLRAKSLVQLMVDEQVQSDAFDLLSKYSDHKLSMTDATIVVLTKRFNIPKILTFDSDFTKIGLSTLP